MARRRTASARAGCPSPWWSEPVVPRPVGLRREHTKPSPQPPMPHQWLCGKIPAPLRDRIGAAVRSRTGVKRLACAIRFCGRPPADKREAIRRRGPGPLRGGTGARVVGFKPVPRPQNTGPRGARWQPRATIPGGPGIPSCVASEVVPAERPLPSLAELLLLQTREAARPRAASSLHGRPAY